MATKSRSSSAAVAPGSGNQLFAAITALLIVVFAIIVCILLKSLEVERAHNAEMQRMMNPTSPIAEIQVK